MDIEIGRAKRGRRAYSFDDIAIVPSRRTRDPEEVSVAWQIDAYRFDIPVMAAPMDSVMSPDTAIAFGRAGGLGVLDLEGLWTRYDDPLPLLHEVSQLRGHAATEQLQEIYAKPIDARSDVSAGQGDARRRHHRRRRAVAAADEGVRPVGDRRRPRPLRHPRHHSLGRACLRPGRAAQPQAVHLRARRARHRRRLRHTPGGAAPHAHRRCRRARRVRRGRCAHDTYGAWARRSDGDGGRRRRSGPTRLPRRVGRSLRARHRRRLDRPQRRHREGDRLRCRRRDGRIAAGPRQGGARRADCTGVPRRVTRACRGASGSRSAPSAPSSRSCTGRRSSPTGR